MLDNFSEQIFDKFFKSKIGIRLTNIICLWICVLHFRHLRSHGTHIIRIHGFLLNDLLSLFLFLRMLTFDLWNICFKFSSRCGISILFEINAIAYWLSKFNTDSLILEKSQPNLNDFRKKFNRVSTYRLLSQIKNPKNQQIKPQNPFNRV